MCTPNTCCTQLCTEGLYIWSIKFTIFFRQAYIFTYIVQEKWLWKAACKSISMYGPYFLHIYIYLCDSDFRLFCKILTAAAYFASDWPVKCLVCLVSIPGSHLLPGSWLWICYGSYQNPICPWQSYVPAALPAWMRLMPCTNRLEQNKINMVHALLMHIHFEILGLKLNVSIIILSLSYCSEIFMYVYTFASNLSKAMVLHHFILCWSALLVKNYD